MSPYLPLAFYEHLLSFPSQVLGMYPGDPGDPGSDCSGTVVRCGDSSGGSGTRSLLPGTSVFGLTTGCLGSHVVSSSETVVPLPFNISFEDAAASPTIHVSILTQCPQLCFALWPCEYSISEYSALRLAT